MMIAYGLGALVFIIAVTRLIKAYNAPKVAAAEAEQAAIKAKAQDERRDDIAARRESRQEAKQARRDARKGL